MLNVVGARVIEPISAGSDSRQVLADFDARDDEDLDRVTSDLETYLDELTDAGVIDEAG